MCSKGDDRHYPNGLEIIEDIETKVWSLSEVNAEKLKIDAFKCLCNSGGINGSVANSINNSQLTAAFCGGA